MIFLIIILLLFLSVTALTLYKNKHRYRKNGDVPNQVFSMPLLGVLTSGNAFPVILGIDNFGVYVIKTSWHGWKREKEYFPAAIIVQVRITEYAFLFGRLDLIVRFSSAQTESIRLPQYYRLRDLQQFYRQWLISSRIMHQG